MLITLSTIGLSNYKEIDYFWAPKNEEPKVYRTAYFPVAVDAIFRPDKMFLMVTPEVCQHDNCQRLQKEIGERLELVPIPRGESEEELWEIFDIICHAVPKDARIILDITHGFRSLPLLVFGAATYLSRSKNTRLERIVYGAYEAGKKENEVVTQAPIFDLTVLADLQDWLQALDAFAIRSDAEKLAFLLKQTHDRQWATREPQQEMLPYRLQNMGQHLEAFSNSLRLLRPLEALKEAAEIQALADEVEREAARWEKPFGHILSTLTYDIRGLASNKPQQLDEKGLHQQIGLVKHYVAKDLLVQAVLLGREWVINWLAWKTLEKLWLDRDVRYRLEKGLGAAAKAQRSKKEVELPPWYHTLPEAKEVSTLWNWLTDLRNDVAHCAMNDDPASAENIRTRSHELVERLERLLPCD